MTPEKSDAQPLPNYSINVSVLIRLIANTTFLFFMAIQKRSRFYGDAFKFLSFCDQGFRFTPADRAGDFASVAELVNAAGIDARLKKERK